MKHGVLALFCAAGLAMTGPGNCAGVTHEMLSFDDLAGWAEDDHEAALATFVKTCPTLRDPDWKALCALAKTGPEARRFFELLFRPVMVSDGSPALFTGYFEPELRGALRKTTRYRYPIYARPPELTDGEPWLTRREIEESRVLEGRGLEIAWVEDPVDIFFLQIQGSGRIRLPDGKTIRIGYAGSNGRNYRSIGQELIRRGIYSEHQVSAQVIRNWVRRNPEAGRELLHTNPSFVFFRRIKGLGGGEGPIGAMNRPVTAGRTIAVDPRFVPLGAPVWIEKEGAEPMHRLMIAQDTGSAIKGAQRADIFFGTGPVAGKKAGKVRDGGRMIVLLPIEHAFALVPLGEAG